MINSFDLPEDSRKKLEIYAQLIRKWQNAINLISNSTLDSLEARHFGDSLSLLPLLNSDDRSLADLGSGAGFPGLVLAMARPDLTVHLVESDSRKCQFMRTVSRETQTPVTIHNRRIESCDLPGCDVITARALAPLDELLDLISLCAGNHTRPCRLLLFKGAHFEAEIAHAQKRYALSYRVHENTESEGVILEINGADLRTG